MLSSQVTFSRGNFPNVSTNFPPPFPRTSFHSIPDGGGGGGRKISERNRVDNYEPTFAFGVR